MKQFLLFKKEKSSPVHGGEYSIGKRKTKRFFSLRKPIHATFRSSLATGMFSFRTKENLREIKFLIKKYKEKFQIKIYSEGIERNHIHLLCRAKDRKAFQDFQRVLAGQIAQKVTKAVRGKPFGKFWDLLSFTKVVEWGRHFRNTLKYVIQSELEASGLIPYTPRKKKPPPYFQTKAHYATPLVIASHLEA